MNKALFAAVAGFAALSAINAGWAAPSAATVCPPFNFINKLNLASNPSFETIGNNGSPSICPSPCVAPQESAAAHWIMHSDNAGSAVSTRVEPLNILNPNPVPHGTDPGEQRRMLHVIASGGEGGVYQRTRGGPDKVMFQVWVYVRSGHVVIQANAGNVGPAAWSTKRDQWEELRVCTDGTVPANFFLVYNQDPKGGSFWIDRAEVRETP